MHDVLENRGEILRDSARFLCTESTYELLRMIVSAQIRNIRAQALRINSIVYMLFVSNFAYNYCN